MIHTEHHGEVSVLRLAHGKASAMDLELCDAIADAVADMEAREETHAVVLTGTGTIFSAGVDLFRITDGGRDYVSAFLPALDRAFRRLFGCTKPVVGAINGHAIAGGAIMTLCCDHRVMADGKGRIGTPELLVGVPYPPLVVEIMRFAMPARHLQRSALLGESVLPADALVRGFVDEVVPADSVVERALEIARQLARVPRATWELTKRQLRRPALEAAPAGIPVEAEIEATWSEPAVIARIRDYLERTIKRK